MLVAFSGCEGKREKRQRQDFENGATRSLFHPLALPLPENATATFDSRPTFPDIRALTVPISPTCPPHVPPFASFAPRLSWLSLPASFDSRPAFPIFRTPRSHLPHPPFSPCFPLFHTPHSSPSASRFPDFRALRASRAPASEPFALSLPENANRGPDCKENVPVWQKTPLGGPSSAGNVEVTRPYRKNAFAPRKKNRRSTNHSS